MKKLVCFHLLNDYSGSPRVLYTILNSLIEIGYEVDLITSKGGILDNLPKTKKLNIINVSYSFKRNKLFTFLNFSLAQLRMFCIGLKYMKQKNIIFYINTILPIGGAFAGYVLKKEVLYHYHEDAYAKGSFYIFLAKIMQKIADKIVCVSEYQKSFLKRKRNVFVIPNVLDKELENRLKPDSINYIEEAFKRKTILMLSSLKKYKGIIDFFYHAHNLPQFDFLLVINDNMNNIQLFIDNNHLSIPSNLSYFPQQADVVNFYKKSSLILNLSHSDKFIETFGLTVLEAKVAGLPAIVPEVGGISELIDSNINGYKIDSKNIYKMEKYIKLVLTNKVLYTKLCKEALRSSMKYDISTIIKKIIEIIEL